MPNPTTVPLAGSTVSYLFLYVHDFARMLSFYRDQLGLTVYFLQEGVCAFLQTSEGRGPAIALYAGRQIAVTAESHWFVAFDVPDLATVVAALHQQGVVTGAIINESFGRYVKFADPEGNILEVHQAAP